MNEQHLSSERGSRFKTTDESLIIRQMRESDCTLIARAFASQGWDKPSSQYLTYWCEHLDGKRDILLAEYDGQFAG